MRRTLKGAQDPRLEDIACLGTSSYLPEGAILPYIGFVPGLFEAISMIAIEKGGNDG